MNKARLVMVVLIMSVSFIVTGCLFRSTTSLSILQYYLEKTVEEEDDEEVVTARIVGAAVNDGSTRIEYAEIEGYFYSQEGTLLATGFARTISEAEEDVPFPQAGLDPGEVWDFIISYSRDAHPSLTILSWNLKKDSSGARIEGQAENTGDVMLSFAEITATCYSSPSETELASGTATTTMLGVGEIWQFVIPCAGPYAESIGRVTVEVTETDCEPQHAQDVDHVTAEVGVLRGGSTVMP